MTNPYKLEENTGIENRNISAVVKSVFLRVTSLKGNVKRRIPTRNEPKEASVSPIMAPEPRYWKKSRELQNKVRWECDLIMRTLAQHVSSRTRSIRVRHTIPASTAKVSLQNISNYRLATGYRVIQLSMMLLRTEWLKRRKESPQNNTLNLRITACPSSTGHVQESRNMRLEAQKKKIIKRVE